MLLWSPISDIITVNFGRFLENITSSKSLIQIIFIHQKFLCFLNAVGNFEAYRQILRVDP